MNDSLLDGVPANKSSLDYARALQEKAAEVGFDWDNPAPALENLTQELEELKQAIKSGDSEHIREELGDLFFAAINVSRKLGLESGDALTGSSQRFMRRFKFIEARLDEKNLNFSDCNLEELDAIWDEAKEQEKN